MTTPPIINHLSTSIDTINAIIDTQSITIYNQIKNIPFSLLHQLCEYFISTKNNCKFVSIKNNDMLCVQMLLITENVIHPYASFGHGYTLHNNVHYVNDQLDGEYIKANEILKYIKQKIDWYISSLTYNSTQTIKQDQLSSNVNMQNTMKLASIIVEYIVNMYSFEEIKAHMKNYNWDLELVTQPQQYMTRSYPHGPLETNYSNFHYWYLVKNQ